MMDFAVFEPANAVITRKVYSLLRLKLIFPPLNRLPRDVFGPGNLFGIPWHRCCGDPAEELSCPKCIPFCTLSDEP